MPVPRIEGFEIQDVLAAGGTSTVYRAVDARRGTPVAIKVLLPHVALQGEFVSRFLNEVLAYERLDHPNVIGCLGGGEARNTYYVALELVGGGTLQRLLKSTGRLPAETAAFIVSEVLRGLEHAHSRGVIHRDIKPGNIMLTVDGVPKLADFGLSLAEEFTRITETGRLVGTPGYMSPEQARGGPLGAGTDLFNCGLVLYECVVGQNPFGTDHPATTLTAITTRHPPPLGVLVPGVAPRLEAVTERLLAKDVGARYDSAVSALGALEACLSRSRDDSRRSLRALLADPSGEAGRHRKAQAAELVASGLRALRGGAREAAELDLMEALECDPESEDARTAIDAIPGRPASRAKPWSSDRARELLREAEGDPRNVRALVNLVRLGRSEGDAIGSLRAYRWARRRSRSDGYTLGQLVAIVGQEEAAHIEGESVERLNTRALSSGGAAAESRPTMAWMSYLLLPLLAVGLTLIGLKLLGGGSRIGLPAAEQTEVAALGPVDPAGSYLARAQEAHDGAHHELALKICREFGRRFPEDLRLPQAVFCEARALAALSRRLEAARAYERFIASHPAHELVAGAHRDLARMFTQEGDSLGALTHWESLLPLVSPEERPEVLFNIAQLSEGLGELDRARYQYDELVRLHPGSSQAHASRLRLGTLHIEMGRPEAARRELEALLSEVPHDSERATEALEMLARLE